MAIIAFKYGQNLKTSDQDFIPGTIYLDTLTHELYYDNPGALGEETHKRIIDTATLIYNITNTIQNDPFGPITGIIDDGSGEEKESGEVSSKTSRLDIAILDVMELDTP